MTKTTTKYLSAVILGVLVLLGSFYLYITDDKQLNTENAFEPFDVSIEEYQLYDMGVADINNDKLLDIYTVNHSAQQSILVNERGSNFKQHISTLGLSQDYVYPGIEDSDQKPRFDTPGIYIYRYKRKLYIHSHLLESEVTGSISIPWGIAVLEEENATTKITNRETKGKISSDHLFFSIRSKGTLVLNGESDIVELQHSFILDGIKPSAVFLGLNKISAKSLNFTVDWRDRHSMAWSDFDGDGTTDVYIGRGGVKGKLKEVSAPVNDELMINQNGVFTNIIDSTLLSKGNCPGRQSSWIDYNSDGLLDLYTSCGRSTLPGYPNQLFTRIDNDTFSQEISATKLDFDKISVYRWLDSDRDGDLDLLAIERNNLIHYVNSNGSFKSNQLASNLVENYVQIVLIDIDLDNDMDAIAVSRTESKLLINENSTFRITSLADIGLPSGGRSISIVDYDNDGTLEVHAVPGGLYKRGKDGSFVSTGLLSSGLGIESISRAICTWFDTENDGKLDAVCAYEYFYSTPLRWWKKLLDKKAPSRYWKTYALKNVAETGNWIHLDLVGNPGNKESIGAKIEILSNGKTQQFTVGQFDTAHYSQGHYRIYAGLDTALLADEIKIVWPNGQTTILEDIESNQLLTIRQ